MFYNTLQNAIINGGFTFWQRGISFTNIISSTYFADRWKFNRNGTHFENVTRSTDIPVDSINQYSALITVATAQPALAATGVLTLNHFIEGSFASRLYGKNIAFSFYVKSSKVGTYCVRFGNSASSRVLMREYTVNTANVWEKKIIRFNHLNVGTWLKDNGVGIGVSFCLGAGTNYNASSDNVWITADQVATTNQVNWMDTVGATFQLSDVVMIEDNTDQTRVPNFIMAGRDYNGELALCKRYFQKSFNTDQAPGNGPNATSFITATGLIGMGIQNLFNGVYYTLPIEMRVSPSVVQYGNSTGLWSYATNNTNETFVAGIGPGGNSPNSLYIAQQGIAAYAQVRGHYTADSDF